MSAREGRPRLQWASGSSEALAGEPHSDEERALQHIELLLSAEAGFRIDSYKRKLIERCVDRRLRARPSQTLAAYAHELEDDVSETRALLSDLLIGVTSFFREPPAFVALGRELERLVDAKPDGEPMRAWVPGCASGEEAFSIAMVLHELLVARAREHAVPVRIFATDVDQRALQYARRARYPRNIVQRVAPERLRRFFHDEGSHYRVTDELRKSVVFSAQNVLTDVPFDRLDLISCRNLLIYLCASAQRRVLASFRASLVGQGLLLLGLSERLVAVEQDFAAAAPEHRIFIRRSRERDAAWDSGAHPRHRPWVAAARRERVIALRAALSGTR